MSNPNSTLNATLSSFKDGVIDKPTFIASMYELHHSKLFDYARFIQGTNIKSLTIENGQVIATTRDRGIRIECGEGDHRIAPIESLNFDDYERQDAAMIEALFVGGGTFFDIGANIGWYSLNLAAARRDAVFHAFEPLPKTYAQLSRNLQLNAFDNIVPHNFGLSNAPATLEFFYYPEGSGNASSQNLTGRYDVEKVSCEVSTLDHFATSVDARVDFIKCDVEGAELFVFQGGLETIRRYKPMIFSEILRKWSRKFNYEPNEIFDTLRGLGYRVFVANGQSLDAFDTMTEETVETNFFFLHAQAHRSQIQRLASR